MPLTATTFDAACRAPMHPSFRWTPVLGDGPARQHRRTEDGNTACGLLGPLNLADGTEERCTDGCWE